jgi:hypothetical protein
MRAGETDDAIDLGGLELQDLALRAPARRIAGHHQPDHASRIACQGGLRSRSAKK